MTCGVFASIFQLLCPSFCPFVLRFISLPCLLSFFALVVFACPLALSLLSLWVVVSFSLSVYAQKERARRVGASSLRGFWVCL